VLAGLVQSNAGGLFQNTQPNYGSGDSTVPPAQLSNPSTVKSSSAWTNTNIGVPLNVWFYPSDYVPAGTVMVQIGANCGSYVGYVFITNSYGAAVGGCNNQYASQAGGAIVPAGQPVFIGVTSANWAMISAYQ
jgi:hypothetical protein